MKTSALPRIVGFSAIAIAAILLVGVAGTDWYVAAMLAILASTILLANTRP